MTRARKSKIILQQTVLRKKLGRVKKVQTITPAVKLHEEPIVIAPATKAQETTSVKKAAAVKKEVVKKTATKRMATTTAAKTTKKSSATTTKKTPMKTRTPKKTPTAQN